MTPITVVDPKAERRLILLVLCSMLLLNVAVLTLAPRVIDGAESAEEDALEPPGDDEDDTTETYRTDVLGEPDEVVEGFESGPADDEKD